MKHNLNKILQVALILAGFSAAHADRPPNIVVIMADDLGWNAVGYHNPEINTPHLDALCKDGIELDNFYVSPMCSPTRAGFLTGRYPIRFGCARAVIPPYRNFGLPTDETTLAEVLENAGYKHRGVFGKWHLGHLQKKWHPTNRGFTEFLGCYNGAIDYFTHERDGQLDWHHNGRSIVQKGSATALAGKAAATFITESAKEEHPFFCYVAFNAPHDPFQVPGRYKQRYEHIPDEPRKTYYAMISHMDDEIGRILGAVQESGATENTLIWFFSDNGGVKKVKDNNTPLKGAKLTAYQGGVRAVACVRFPARYPGGRKITERTAFIDVMPTALSLAGINPKQAGCKPLDGIDLHPLLTGTADKLPERDLYFYHGQKGEHSEPIAVISKEWKLVVNGPSLVHGRNSEHQIELYHINDDPNESANIADSHPEVVERLMKQLVDFRKLQPKDGIPPYSEGKKGFTAPVKWEIVD